MTPAKSSEVSGLDGPAVQLVEAFDAFWPVYKRWLRTRGPESGLSPERMRLLGALHCNGPQIMNALSEELGVSPRNITQLVDALEGEELVRRTPHATDRRATVVELAPRGADICEAGWVAHRAAIAELFEALSERDQCELLRLLELLQQALRTRSSSRGESVELRAGDST